jgi:hypothetical protein
MTGLISDTKKKGKDLARDMAKQIAREPLEILKTAGEQVVGTTETKTNTPPTEPEQKSTAPQNEALEKHLEIQGQSQIKALEQEMKEIRTIKENRAKLEAQTLPTVEPQNPLIEPTSRPKRGLFTGMGNRLQAKRQEKRVENPINQG